MGASPGYLQKQTGKRLDFFEMWCYRRLLRVSWKDTRINKWVLDKIGTSPVLRKHDIENDAFLWSHYKKGRYG